MIQDQIHTECINRPWSHRFLFQLTADITVLDVHDVPFFITAFGAAVFVKG